MRALAGTPTGTGGVFGADVSCAEAWTTNVPNRTSEWLLSTRVDYNVSSNQRLFLRFKTDHGHLTRVRNFISPLFTAFSTQPDYEGHVNYTYAITPRLVNNFIGAVTHNDYVAGVADLNAALAAFPVQLIIFPRVANGGRPIDGSIGPPATYPTGRRATQIQIIDDVSYLAGRQSLKAGVNYRYIREADFGTGAVNRGQFFLPLNNLALGTLSGGNNYYTQSFTANPLLHLRFQNVGFYVQDQWSITPRLKVTATLRFDRNGNPDCADRCFARLISPFPSIDKGPSIPYDQSIQGGLSRAFYNVEAIVPQPRLSVAYNPAWSRQTVLRGGVGLFSDLYPASFLGLMAANPPNLFASTIEAGLVNTAGADSAPAIAAASANAFQSQFASGATLSQLQQAVAPTAFAAPNYYSIPSILRNPKYMEWSLDVEHRFDPKSVLDIRYQGNHGYDIFVANPYLNARANPATFPDGIAGLPTAVPDPRFGAILQYTNDGYSNYHAMVAEFRRGFGHGFQGQISYTWSHALDTLSNGGLLPFAFDLSRGGSLTTQINPSDLRSLNYSNADYDVRHNLTADFIWEGPVKLKRHWISTALGGWSVGTRVNAHTGTPFSVTNAQITRALAGSFAVLADVIDARIGTTCGRSAIDTPCFSPTQFAPPTAQADLGNLPRNSFRGPGFFNIDSTLYKTLPIGERMRFTFGASAYNVLNHPNFADPNADVSFPGLGLITSTVGGPSSPYGSYGGPSSRTVVVTGKFKF